MILLDITLTNGWAMVMSIAIVLILWSVISSNNDLKKQKDTYFKKVTETEKNFEISKNESSSKLKEQSLTFQKREAELKVSYQNWAFAEFEKFKKLEIEKIQKEAENQSLKAASVLLQKWKIESEAKIRQDAINRSYSVNLGKITEHLVPFHQAFLSQFNPKDARFIGNPIDLIVFDGYADKKDEIQVYLVEIKTGNSRLTEVQKKIKEAVLNGNIRWAEINPSNNNQTLILNTSVSNGDIIKQLVFDFDNTDDIQKLISTLEMKDSETRDILIDRVADAIVGAGKLVDNEGYTLQGAIDKKIDDLHLTFKTFIDKEIFINSVIKSLE